MTKHESTVLEKYVNDPTFNIQGVMDTLDMSRNGSINKIKNLAVEILRDKKWKV